MKGRLAKNIVWNYASGLTSTVGLLVLYPFAARIAGAEAYGMWVLGFATVQLFTLLDFGLGTAVIRMLARWSPEPSTARREFIAVALATFGALGGLFALLVLIVLPLYYSWVSIPEDVIEFVLPVSVLVAIAVFVSMIGRAANSILWAEDRPDIERKAAMVGVAMRALGLGACFIAGGGILGVAVVETVSILIGPIACVIAVYRRYGAVSLRLAAVRTHLKPLLKWSSVLFIGTVASLVAMQAPLFIVGATMGLVEVTAFGAVTRLYQSARLPVTWVTNPFTASVANAPDGSRELSESVVRLYRVALLSAWAVAMPIIIFAPTILTVWMGSPYTFASGGLQSLTVGIVAAGTILPSVLVLNLRHTPWIPSIWYSVWCVASIPIVWIGALNDNLLLVGAGFSLPQVFIAVPLLMSAAGRFAGSARTMITHSATVLNVVPTVLTGVLVWISIRSDVIWTAVAYCVVMIVSGAVLMWRRRMYFFPSVEG